MFLVFFLGLLINFNPIQPVTCSNFPVIDVIPNNNPWPALLQAFSNAILGQLNAQSFPSFVTEITSLVSLLFPLGPVPKVPERSWGEKKGDTSIRPFTVHFSDEMISDLRGRIQNRRNTTRSLRGAAHTYGTNSDFLRWFLDSWADKYDFRRRESLLNKFPQFLVSIQDLDIHYIHVKPPNPQGKKVVPLLLIHGWPVTAFEYNHVIEYFQMKSGEFDFLFELIVPGLPGYGYSEGTNKIGLAPYEVAVIFKNLMVRVGHPRFYVHAYDVGQLVADAMAVLFPEMVMGLHTSFALSFLPKTLVKYALGQLLPAAVVEPRYESRLYTIFDKIVFVLENFGYFHVQTTRPDNVGIGLDETPVALAAWILESILIAAAPENILVVDGNFHKTYDILDWFDTLTVYWATQSATTSVRLYAEYLSVFQNPTSVKIQFTPIKVPTTVVRFANELIYQPDDFIRDRYENLVYTTTLDIGGHFAAFEYPDVLANHIYVSVKKMEEVNAKNNA